MEDASSERIVAHGSSPLALIVVVAGLAIGEVAILRADEPAGRSRQAASGASLLAPQSIAPDLVDQPETREPNASSAPLASRPAGARITSHESHGLNGGRPYGASITTSASFTPQRLVEQAAQHLADAEASLRRQASYSAKASAIESLRLLAEARDYTDGQTNAAERLSEGLAAIRESSDFMGRYGATDPGDMRRMIESHATSTLKETETTRLNGASAADIYLNTARERLASIATGNPLAARALVVLAKIYRQETALGPHADAVAVNLLRAALQSNPSDPALANELGFLLMKQGILDEAQWALEHSMALAPTAPAAQNLAEVMRQRGNLRGARALAARLQDPQDFLARPAQGSNGPTVQTLTPGEFAALSRPHQAFAPSAAGNVAAPPAPSTSREAIEASVAVPAAETPAPQSEPAPGPVGRVAKAVSGWFQ